MRSTTHRQGSFSHWWGLIFSEISTSADVFLRMNEHEGFCVPLVEAMYFGVPIVAYAAAAVSDTLGGYGVLVMNKLPENIVKAMIEAYSEGKLQSTTVENRLEIFSRTTGSQTLLGTLQKLY